MKVLDVIEKLGNYMEQKAEELKRQERQALQARQQQQVIQQEHMASVYLYPHISDITLSNIHFETAGCVNVRCKYDRGNAIYRVQTQLIISSNRHLNRPCIHESLEESIQHYHFKLQAERYEESLKLQALYMNGTLSQENVYSFNKRYDFLNHELKLMSIEHDSENPLLVNVWFAFR